MSDLTNSVTPAAVTAAAPANAGAEPNWAKTAISIFVLCIFMGAFVIAYVSKNDGSLNLMMGASVAMAMTVVGYWLGSSSGSAKKTELMSATPAVVDPTTARGPT